MRMAQPSFPQRAPGFTLVELLVVITIIAILTAILVPAAGGMRVRANQTVCASNMRQIGMALTSFSSENGGSFPVTTHTADEAEQAWIYTLAPFLGNVDEVRLCPADPAREKRRQQRGTSYVLNEYIAVPTMDRFGGVKESFTNLRALARPAATITAFIVADGTTTDHTHSRNWRKGWTAVLQDICPDRHRSGDASRDRTKGSANYLFADGHVEAIEAAELRRRILRNENVALPPTE